MVRLKAFCLVYKKTKNKENKKTNKPTNQKKNPNCGSHAQEGKERMTSISI